MRRGAPRGSKRAHGPPWRTHSAAAVRRLAQLAKRRRTASGLAGHTHPLVCAGHTPPRRR